jgi:GNAT superfamily N-acetyltransferase
MTSPLSLAVLEGIEADFMHRYQSEAPAATRAELGISSARFGAGVALVMRDDPSTYWNKALGFDEPVTGDLIGDVIEFYRSERAPRAGIQIAPALLPPDWDEIAAVHGLRAGGGIHKLAARIDELPPGRREVRVDEVGAEHAAEWAAIMLDAFGMPVEGGLGDMLAAVVTNPAFRAFGVWDGDRLVAVGNLLVRGPVASLNAGATTPAYRGRGAQSALIAARVEAAAAAGCEWVVAETGESGSSFNNFRRAGLRSRYLRRNWVWEA